ncbi:lysophospholipid acyltransferase family protein [Euzebya rosea]|uniref:lysophospholipid acyltransferase family protein n=1 Tax=Euzebya rosea TaxID=2052804 RepID=UPI000D3ECA5F|nr:lysophospholipid acyltransferase family protein [Euzebya rosea]
MSTADADGPTPPPPGTAVVGDGPSTPPMRVSHAVLGPTVLWWLRATVTGTGQVPASGGALLAANHRSFLDHFAMGAASPRPMRFFGKASLTEGIGGRYNVAMGMIPVKRGTADLGALDVAVELLRAGALIGIFPEGTRSTDGRLYRFRSGMARMAAAAEVPIVPVGMTGMATVWPRGQSRPSMRRPRRGVVGVHFGEAVHLPDDSPRSRRQATVAVHDQVASLCGQPLADGFAEIPDS